MNIYLLWIGIGVALVGYSIIFILYFKYKNDTNHSCNGFDVAKSITSDYENINIVESSNSFISRYYINRNVVRLTKRVYSGSDIFSFSVAAYLSGISFVNHQYLSWIGKIIPSFDFFNKSSIIFSVISYFFYSKGDARIGMILGLFILIYQYFYLQFFSLSMGYSLDKIRDNKDKIGCVLVWVYRCNVLFFISSLIFMLRFVAILSK